MINCAGVQTQIKEIADTLQISDPRKLGEKRTTLADEFRFQLGIGRQCRLHGMLVVQRTRGDQRVYSSEVDRAQMFFEKLQCASPAAMRGQHNGGLAIAVRHRRVGAKIERISIIERSLSRSTAW